MRREVVYLSDSLRTACAVLNVLPLPGVGAIIAGARNPHSPYLRNGILQMILVLFGSWPLIVPGAIGLIWAIWDGVRIGTKGREPARWSNPTRDAPPESILPDPDELRAQKRQAKLAAREQHRKEVAMRQAARELQRQQQREAKATRMAKKDKKRSS